MTHAHDAQECSRRSPVRLMCVDDNALVAQAVERRVACEPDMAWSGWAERTDDVLAHVQRENPDVILLDIDMPGRDAFEVVREIAQQFPDARVVMFSGYVRADYIERAIDAGAWGYISKNESVSDMLAAVRRVAAGEFMLTQEVLVEHGRS
jgi:DNA-binding NarL/FixJ family response regulator